MIILLAKTIEINVSCFDRSMKITYLNVSVYKARFRIHKISYRQINVFKLKIPQIDAKNHFMKKLRSYNPLCIKICLLFNCIKLRVAPFVRKCSMQVRNLIHHLEKPLQLEHLH